ncbi:MAG: ATP-binding protein [Pseudomonadota bacterium]
MRHFQPRSLLFLTLLGYAAVALPLMAALVVAAYLVDRLATQSEGALRESVIAVQGSQALSERALAMERAARSYVLLGNDAALAVMNSLHQETREIAGNLGWQTAEHVSQDELDWLIREQRRALTELEHSDPARLQRHAGDVVERVADITRRAHRILYGSHQEVDRSAGNINAAAVNAQQLLFWSAGALMLLAVVLVAIFSVLIIRPINQINRAIVRLGDEDFTQPVAVSGPLDLRSVGRRLDWLRQRLAEIDDEKTRFLHHVSHELKTPLTAIDQGVGLLRDQGAGALSERQRRTVDIMETNCRRLHVLIENLLRARQRSNGAASLALEWMDLAHLVTDVLDCHRTALEARGLRVVEELAPARIYADAEKLRAVMDNLLDNAIRFSPPGSDVEVKLTSEDGGTVLEVSDAGPGIPAHERGAVLEPFKQGSVQPSGARQGSGLGLAIANEYVTAHGGTLELRSSGRGGLRVRVVLRGRCEGKDD